ncbi:YceI family protein [Lichenibacterium ramalinae]|uniref:YceI family protein n=1 Tax=Lichenibacterium ramalinae TaxID=2316527 RepID=A0A4V1RIF5_9HYPH|nr:YceI family protein [Lichenibacterium ramalinae]RYB03636.1 YceI family protein [Lichenibacterium ramalinae]
MRSTFAAAALLLAIAGSAEAATWTVDPAKSRLGFSGAQTGAPFTGRFKTWTAAIDFDPAHPESGHVLATVDTASATTDDPQKDEALPGSDWFDAAGFAKATFEATGFVPKGGDSYETAGKLTLRGVGKDVVLPFTLTIAGDQAHAVGHAKLVRTDFGVGQGSWASADYVALDVTVDLDLVATRKP